MQRGLPVVRFVGKVATQSATAVLATLVGGYFLAALNLRGSDPAHTAAEPAAGASEGRTLTREYVKSLREGRETAVEVRPVAAPVSIPTDETVVTKAVGVVTPPVARKESRLRSEASATPPPPVVAAPPLGAPVVLTPAPVAEAAVDDQPHQVPEPHGQASVFSMFSTMVGKAANAAGDGINFVIDLPGRAIGRGRDPHHSAVTPHDRQPVATESPAGPLRFAGS
jgi:hypothetical protein